MAEVKLEFTLIGSHRQRRRPCREQLTWDTGDAILLTEQAVDAPDRRDHRDSIDRGPRPGQRQNRPAVRSLRPRTPVETPSRVAVWFIPQRVTPHADPTLATDRKGEAMPAAERQTVDLTEFPNLWWSAWDARVRRPRTRALFDFRPQIQVVEAATDGLLQRIWSGRWSAACRNASVTWRDRQPGTLNSFRSRTGSGGGSS